MVCSSSLRLWASSIGRCCALALFLASIAFGQIYKFRVYGNEDGLRDLAVLCMVQDHDGYIWAGTLNGLYRYDGDRFERMGPEHGLVESLIVSLAVTPDGSVWAGTASGLMVFRDHAFQAVHFAQAVILESQSSLAVDPATNALWVATKQGLASVEPSSYQRGPPQAVFASFAPHTIISAVSFAADGSLWFGSGGGLFQYQRKSAALTRFGSSDGVPNDSWEAIRSDGEGQLWARSATRLIRLPKGEKQFSADQVPRAEFGALAVQRNGSIAIPTVQGLAVRDRNEWKILGTKSGLPMDSVSSFFIDREGSPWIGTNGGGVARWLGFPAWENWTAPAWLEDDAVWSIAEDHSGDIWVGNNTGIMKMTQDGQPMIGPARNRFRFGDVIRTMAVGEGNDLWVGTAHHGLFRCNVASEHCEPVGKESGLLSRGIGSMVLDSSGVLWVTAGDGIYFGNVTQRTIRFETLHIDGLPPGEQPGMLAIGPHRELLAASHRGLWIRRNSTWRNIGRAQGLLDDELDQVAADRLGNIFVAYRKRLGVSQIRLKPGGGLEIKHLTQQNEIRSNFIYTLGTDARNHLWIGTDSGIDRLAGGHWRHLGTANGLIWTDLNTNAFLADSRHGLWFGTSRGLAHYQPHLDTTASVAPEPLITDLVVDGRSVDPGHPFVVPYRNRDVTMRFSALSFVDELDTHFEYRIVGLLNNWRPAIGRDLHLLNPPAGSYSLEVIAATSNNGKRSQPIRLQFVVETPWWQSRMFYFLSVCISLIIARAIWQWRMRALLNRGRQLERAVQDRTSALEERTRELLTEQRLLLEARAELRVQALRDPLTNLWNRRAIGEMLEDPAMASSHQREPFAVIMADLDNFKSINDCHGHQCGDQVLVETALRFAAAFRPSDFVGRYGGEEIIVLLRNCDLITAAERTEGLRRQMENEPVWLNGQPVTVMCSFGIAAAGPGASGVKQLISAADEALYEAKRAGRNRVVALEPFALTREG